MIDWELLTLLSENEDGLDERTRFERREFRRELQWSISPLTFAAILLGSAATTLFELIVSASRRRWSRWFGRVASAPAQVAVPAGTSATSTTPGA
jgi:hypothetical protein